MALFAAHANLFIIFLSSSFFSSKPSEIMADVGKLLWAQMSYIHNVVFVVVHLYPGLLENVLPCEFCQHWGYIARRHFIAYDSGP